MLNYAWPGNVRALRHAIERAIILSQLPLLEPIDFQLDDYNRQVGEKATSETTKHAAEVGQHSSDLNLERLEKNTVEQALKKHHYNISHAAKDLGLTRAALYRRMEKYGF